MRNDSVRKFEMMQKLKKYRLSKNPLSKKRKHNQRKVKIKQERDYKKYLLSSEWKKKREIILMRDDFKCTVCGNRKTLQIHHLTYENIFNEKDEDLITLCKRCHEDKHPDKIA